MNIIILSGGSGKRLWPLSNEIRSKQFIKLFRNESGQQESMIQKMYRKLKQIDCSSTITIATSLSQVSFIRNQLGNDVKICVEPCRRDTFPAILLAVLHLRDIQNIDENEYVVVCPVDSYTDEGFFKALADISDIPQKYNSDMALIGIEPNEPSEKYGYIIPIDNNSVSAVKCFKEKPDKIAAERYISEGALWNGGVFAFQIKYIIEKARQIYDFRDYNDLYKKYASLDKISFDYAIVEKEKNIRVMRFDGIWKDIGTWSALSETMDNPVIGKVCYDKTCKNTKVINELDIPMLCMGLQNMIIAASPDGILVSEKESSEQIKQYIDSIKLNVMFSEKSWGSYRVIDTGLNSLTVKAQLKKGSRMTYHAHTKRDEIWNIISGNGKVVIDDCKKNVASGDIVSIPAGTKHTIAADSELELIELQLGTEIDVNDKIKYELGEDI